MAKSIDTESAPKSSTGTATAPRPATKTATKTAAKTAAKAATRDAGKDTTRSATKSARPKRQGKTSDASKAAPNAGGKAAPRGSRSPAETERIRTALSERLEELRGEHNATMSEINELQRERLTDSAGDDQADTGTKTFEREQEITLANAILERVTQVERALERLDEGNYGWCEKCGNPIPVERLAAFPSATLCVTCKQLEERR